MNETQVVAALLQYYKGQGMDLHYVLDDPVFSKLSLRGKIDSIKAHAQEIVEGTSPGFNKIDRLALVRRAGLLGATGAMNGAMVGASLGALAKTSPFFPAVFGAVTGLGMGGVSALIEQRESVNRKHAVIDQLQRVVNEPTDGNAVGALSAGGVYGMQAASKHEAYAALRNIAHDMTGQHSLTDKIKTHFERVNAQTPQVQ